MKSASILCCLLLSSVTGHAQVGESLEVLSAYQETPHFRVHYRPGSRAGAAVDRTSWLVELEYARILETLDIEGLVDESESFLLFLYDDLNQLSQVSGVGGSGGFSAGRESHIPWDNDQTRLHELVHIVVAAMESTGDEPRNMFFAEGISNAVLRHVHGVPVHAVAAYELKRGSLPGLQEMAAHEDFYRFLGQHAGLNGYDVAGSYFLFLLEQFGGRRVMSYYHGQPIGEALGKSIGEVEKAWRAYLMSYPLRYETELLLRQRRGDGGEFEPSRAAEGPSGEPDPELAELLDQPEAWTSLQSQLTPIDEVGLWNIARDTAEAENSNGSDWSIAMTPDDTYGDCILRVKVKPLGKCWGVKLRYGDACRAMVLGMGSFIYVEQSGVAFDEKLKLQDDQELELVLRVRQGKATVYLDGKHVLDAEVDLVPSAVGVGLVGGKARFTEFSIHEF